MGPPPANANPQGDDWLSWEELLTEVDGPAAPSAAPPAAEAAPSEVLHADSFEGLVTPPGVELPASFQLPPDIQALLAERARIQQEMDVLTGKAPPPEEDPGFALRFPLHKPTPAFAARRFERGASAPEGAGRRAKAHPAARRLSTRGLRRAQRRAAAEPSPQAPAADALLGLWPEPADFAAEAVQREEARTRHDTGAAEGGGEPDWEARREALLQRWRARTREQRQGQPHRRSPPPVPRAPTRAPPLAEGVPLAPAAPQPKAPRAEQPRPSRSPPGPPAEAARPRFMPLGGMKPPAPRPTPRRPTRGRVFAPLGGMEAPAPRPTPRRPTQGRVFSALDGIEAPERPATGPRPTLREPLRLDPAADPAARPRPPVWRLSVEPPPPAAPRTAPVVAAPPPPERPRELHPEPRPEPRPRVTFPPFDLDRTAPPPEPRRLLTELPVTVPRRSAATVDRPACRPAPLALPLDPPAHAPRPAAWTPPPSERQQERVEARRQARALERRRRDER